MVAMCRVCWRRHDTSEQRPAQLMTNTQNNRGEVHNMGANASRCGFANDSKVRCFCVET
jgi:hypothetical protein